MRIVRDGDRVFGVKVGGNSCLSAAAVLFEAVMYAHDVPCFYPWWCPQPHADNIYCDSDLRPPGEKSGRGRRLIYAYRKQNGASSDARQGCHRWVAGEFTVESENRCCFRCVLPALP
eukprot:SAG31_NODE_19171_length_610_cov_0.970646_1_plen_116_part_10